MKQMLPKIESGPNKESLSDAGNGPYEIDAHRGSSKSRRAFLGGTASVFLAGWLPGESRASKRASSAEATHVRNIGRADDLRRKEEAYRIRLAVARRQREIPLPAQSANGDEERYANRIGSYSKGLPHNKIGEVDLKAYNSLRRALRTGNPKDFENIPMGGIRELVNPQAGLCFELQGPDSHSLRMEPPPAFDGAKRAYEIAENYWMALVRDVPFSQYKDDPLVNQAASDLSKFSDIQGPKAGGKVTVDTLFRGKAPDNMIGPYISQFLWKKTLYGSETIDRRMRTVLPGIDYVTKYDDWLAIQNGDMPWPDQYDRVPRYIRNGRDLGQWVHYDLIFQAYFDALLVLFDLGTRLDPANPYLNSSSQIGFGTFGTPHIATAVCSVAASALKAVWYQKWFVHRTLRPEEFAGRIHNHITGGAKYPIHRDILNSQAIEKVFDKNGTYLLPQAFPEGSPLHPSYGAGHATVAGASATVLKAYFDESFVIRGAVQSSDDGTALDSYTGPDLTVGGELNKVAYNIAMGRNFAGIHWRSDAEESLKLGEEVAIRWLRDERNCFNEQFSGFSLTKFDGTKIVI